MELRAVGGSVALSFHSAVLDNRVVAEALPLKATNINHLNIFYIAMERLQLHWAYVCESIETMQSYSLEAMFPKVQTQKLFTPNHSNRT